MNLHVETLYGDNNHHIAESCFKGVARALRGARSRSIRGRASWRVPSTKGSLTGEAMALYTVHAPAAGGRGPPTGRARRFVKDGFSLAGAVFSARLASGQRLWLVPPPLRRIVAIYAASVGHDSAAR